MMKNSFTNEPNVESFYDRIIKVYNVSFKFNRYSHSLERYLSDNLPLHRQNPRILDAGCGPGLLTEALLKATNLQSNITGIDLSVKSIEAAKKAIGKKGRFEAQVQFAQANILNLPFHDESFDLVVTSGALEYVSLRSGLEEIARVLVPGGHLIYFPLKPSLGGYLLAISFRMQMYLPDEVIASLSSNFEILSHHNFTAWEPIGWSKSAILSRKL